MSIVPYQFGFWKSLICALFFFFFRHVLYISCFWVTVGFFSSASSICIASCTARTLAIVNNWKLNSWMLSRDKQAPTVLHYLSLFGTEDNSVQVRHRVENKPRPK